MTNNFRKYQPFINAGMQGMIAYRVDFLIFRIGDLMGAFVTYFIWLAIFNSSSSSYLNGFSFQEMTVYIFLSFYTGIITRTNVSSQIGSEVKDGSISMRLLKPISFTATYLFEEMGKKLIEVYILAIPIFGGIILYQLFQSENILFRITNLAIYILSSFISYLINFYLSVCFGFTSFIFKNIWGLILMKNSIVNFMSGALIPLGFFPKIIADVLQVLPFASLLYLPVMISLNKYTLGKTIILLLLQLFWLAFFFILSKFIWNIVIKHLSVQGG
ncbi:ABC transporter permease [Enterococcus rivorum]|uniref:ABC transporter permease n=1 Tax=Enterococcus rivorum TaxID=762845 RepID=A0A1E5KUC1_9ENTE|nr:ABC-2 family transporter protein [Enterococcus rivorum]MBP2098937.1 ABC-2 type transport system permease protein [Enterococcus rivorum]OEH81466.1 ABC transporter permease [Enterococcus rivorum]